MPCSGISAAIVWPTASGVGLPAPVPGQHPARAAARAERPIHPPAPAEHEASPAPAGRVHAPEHPPGRDNRACPDTQRRPPAATAPTNTRWRMPASAASAGSERIGHALDRNPALSALDSRVRLLCHQPRAGRRGDAVRCLKRLGAQRPLAKKQQRLLPTPQQGGDLASPCRDRPAAVAEPAKTPPPFRLHSKRHQPAR